MSNHRKFFFIFVIILLPLIPLQGSRDVEEPNPSLITKRLIALHTNPAESLPALYLLYLRSQPGIDNEVLIRYPLMACMQPIYELQKTKPDTTLPGANEKWFAQVTQKFCSAITNDAQVTIEQYLISAIAELTNLETTYQKSTYDIEYKLVRKNIENLLKALKCHK